jgi:hypothetical protein
MPRFVGERDVDFFRHINTELIDEVIETPVIVYKLITVESPTNIYGEAPLKTYHVGVQISALIKRSDKTPTSEGHVLDVNQSAIFSFSRQRLNEKDIYPEAGDIIEYDGSYWEIDNASENQLLVDQPFFNWSIVCMCHLTRKSALQLDERTHLTQDTIE